MAGLPTIARAKSLTILTRLPVNGVPERFGRAGKRAHHFSAAVLKCCPQKAWSDRAIVGRESRALTAALPKAERGPCGLGPARAAKGPALFFSRLPVIMESG